jgi:transcription-repair coupling factor (superfamily II helicase)
MWQHVVDRWKQKKITIIPNVENKIFQENRESFLDYIWENGDFHPKYGGLILQLDKQFAKAEEAFENYLKILSTLRQSNYFKSS